MNDTPHEAEKQYREHPCARRHVARSTTDPLTPPLRLAGEEDNSAESHIIRGID
ncbi:MULTISPECIES: hypothetical protein [Streptomyces]|uniref:Uncharacterized protein n=1 Tax=Streptomyces sp. NBC_00093 TaxID=2975649 RepID=A0AAU2ABB3_9ACTN